MFEPNTLPIALNTPVLLPVSTSIICRAIISAPLIDKVDPVIWSIASICTLDVPVAGDPANNAELSANPITSFATGFKFSSGSVILITRFGALRDDVVTGLTTTGVKIKGTAVKTDTGAI